SGRAAASGFPFPLPGGGPVTGQPTRGWTITPSLGLTQSYNDNVFFTANNRKSDFITNVNGGLAMAVDTARLQGGLNATLGYNFYANQTRQNGATLNGGGQFLLTLVPDHLFISARGAATTQPFGSALDPQARTGTASGNLFRTYSVSLSPYGLYRFGGTATAFAGYVFQYVDQNRVGRAPTESATTIEDLLRRRDAFATSFSSHQGYVGARTGEDFGRLAMQGSLSGTWFEGSGLYEGAYRHLALLETRYAFLRSVAGLVEVGYERERFNTVPKTDIDGPVWAVGARLTPNPDSLIIVKYGRRDGFNSWRVNGTWAVGVRTTIFATYQETLTTSALFAADLLSTTVLDPLGNPVDAQTGAPVLPGLLGQVIGASRTLSRQKLGTAGISQTWPRDTISLTATYLESTPIATAPGAPQQTLSIETTSFGLTWSRSLTPLTSMSVFGSYALNTTSVGNTAAPSSNDFTSISAGASLGTSLSPSLGLGLTYQFRWRDNTTATANRPGGGSAIQNVFTAGLRQSF
ncbi:MAG: TIGR03016 family PEP-CTERM system-associated outer membrane protein, partial [Elioraea sp.]|nr:TIGR03016 family PEP-CTERM system-associated outer membrane protein [Elioraea sp.]